MIYNVAELFKLSREKLAKLSPPELKFYIWESYNRQKIKDRKVITADSVNDQTINFFAAIPVAHTIEFNLSSKNILQLGISTGNYYLLNDLTKRTIVGYDYSPAAMDYVNANGMLGRLTDLDSIDPETHELTYTNQLETDLSVATDILIIRTLECLQPEVVTLLMLNILRLARSGSAIYIEIEHSPTNSAITSRKIPNNYIPSFFAPRIDFEFQRCKVTKNEVPDSRNADDQSVVERLIVKKR